jgi:hypothetical protein
MAKTRGVQSCYVEVEDGLDSGAIPAATGSTCYSCAAHDPESLESGILVITARHFGTGTGFNLQEQHLQARRWRRGKQMRCQFATFDKHHCRRNSRARNTIIEALTLT